MDRKDKLEAYQTNQRMKEMQFFSETEVLVDTFIEQFAKFRESLDAGLDVNVDDLMAELKQINALRDDITALDKSISEIKIPNMPDSVEVVGLASLVKNIDKLTRKEVVKVEQADLSHLKIISGRLDKLIAKVIAIKAPAQGQKLSDYLPMRRVVKVGNVFMWDDSFYTGGGGGGSSSFQNISGSPSLVTLTANGGLPIGGKLITQDYDYVKATYPDSTTEVYTHRLGGSGGTLVGVLTVTYTTSSKDVFDSVTRS